MRHRKSRELNRFTSWRKATLISLAKNLLIHQRIVTTETKAKLASSLIEKLISLAKQNTLSAKRQCYRILGSHRLVSLLFSDIGVRFNHKIGGYTRVLNIGRRRGDNAKLAILELTEIIKKERRPTKKKKEVKAEIEAKPEVIKEKHIEEKKIKPPKGFLGGLRRIFKKERDAL